MPCPVCKSFGTRTRNSTYICPACATVWQEEWWVSQILEDTLPLGTVLLHPAHGPCHYGGRTKLVPSPGEPERDYAILEFAGTDRSYYPLNLVHKLGLASGKAVIRKM